MTEITSEQSKRKPRATWQRALIGGALGVIVGVGVSWVSGQLGSSCTIMCNPFIAGAMGAVLGGSIAVAE